MPKQAHCRNYVMMMISINHWFSIAIRAQQSNANQSEKTSSLHGAGHVETRRANNGVVAKQHNQIRKQHCSYSSNQDAPRHRRG
jgi:hypothetical protein